MNEDSKALYHELVTGQIISKIKENNDHELTQDENNKNKSKPPVHTGGFDLSKYLFKIRMPLFLILKGPFKELRVFYIVLCLNNYINS